jgi:hypothetical protein
MAEWQMMNDYYIQNGEWTICKIASMKKPYELWRGKDRIGMYATANEAKAAIQSPSHPANREGK